MDGFDKFMYVLFTVTIIGFAGLVGSIALAPFMGVNFAPGTGEKIGQVVRVSNQGIICKTWEGQLIRGGMSSGSGGFGVVPFEFTITDPKIADQVVDYMQRQVEVKITYDISGVYKTCSSESGGHFLTSIEPLKP